MKNNQPVTQREFDYDDDVTLMSMTDTQSYVTYANSAFIQVSGFERDELIGKPHNLVRHPDMPKCRIPDDHMVACGTDVGEMRTTLSSSA